MSYIPPLPTKYEKDGYTFYRGQFAWRRGPFSVTEFAFCIAVKGDEYIANLQDSDGLNIDSPPMTADECKEKYERFISIIKSR